MEFKEQQSTLTKWVATSVVTAIVFFGSTFAANISLTSGGTEEFGQGVQLTAACSGNTALTVKPDASFKNVSGGGSFYFSGYTISNIPSSCYGVDFTLNAYGDTSSAALKLFNTNVVNSIVYNDNGTYALNGATISGQSITTNSTSSFTVTFANPVSLSGSVYKLTLQSGNHHTYCATGGNCSIGDIGPGGGYIFYYSSTPFTETGAPCGSSCHFLEAAPETWYSGSGDPSLPWWVSSDYTFNPNGTTLGTGLSNTDTILVMRTGNPDGVSTSRDYNGGGQTDWFLPSLDELQLMYTNRAHVPGLQNGDYWSSSQNQWYLARYVNMAGGTAASIHRYNNKFIRPIRAF